MGLPTPSAASASNTYSGGQSPGAWTFIVNHTSNTYTYRPITYSTASTSGTFQSAHGFLQLGADSSAGYAVEVPGRAAILRPGDSTTPPIFAVPQTQCYAITGRVRFQYIGMQAGTFSNSFGGSAPTLGYGSVVASTDTTGKSWQFQSLQGNIVIGPGSFNGSCATSNDQATISFTGQQSILNLLWTPNQVEAPTAGTQSNIWIGPSGFFASDQSDPTASSPTGASVAGIIEPTSALTTSSVTTQQYAGFFYQSATALGYNGTSPTITITSPIAFGQTASSGTSMTGGIYPNDDVSQTPEANIVLTLGAQDATYNGLYSSATLTVLDPNQNCANYTGGGSTATTSLNAQGYVTCTFPAIVVAGNPENKYVLFVTSYNWAARIGGAPLQLYLVQQ
ncbi:hypothetical protein GCM10011586_39920 [Silvibacterium dinghuense]|nr:hypothetical protein GCM10011586_39920 [Silvibacterium dinghuense]